MKTLIKHAKIYTLDSVNTITEALVIENGKILKTGTGASNAVEILITLQVKILIFKKLMFNFHVKLLLVDLQYMYYNSRINKG